MLVSDIQIIDLEDSCELRAQVKFDTHWVWGDEPFDLWYRFPLLCRECLSADHGDPFVAAFLPMAMVLGESLEIVAGISPQLADTLPQIQEIYRCWNPTLSEVVCRAPLHQPIMAVHNAGAGLFVSMGADSSYTLLKNVMGEGRGPTISHLINVLGFDIYLWESSRYPAVLSAMTKLAHELDKQVIPVATNLRDVSDRIVDWVRMYHGAALASVSLALGRMLSHVYIASGQTYGLLIGSGSHPLLDPLWSTESTYVLHDGLERTRLQKFQYLARSPRMIRHLRVCAADDTTGSYNCGVCRKCIYATIALHVAGVLGQCETLPQKIDVDLLRTLDVGNALAVRGFRELVDALGGNKEDSGIRSALQDRLDECTTQSIHA